MNKKFDEIIAERTDSNLPDNLLSKALKLLNQKDGMLCDIPWVEGNLLLGNKTNMHIDSPEVDTKEFNVGIETLPVSKTVVDSCCILEANSEVDREFANCIKNFTDFTDFRFKEDSAYIEGFKMTAENKLIYGDTSINPSEFNGLAVRYNDLNGITKNQIINASPYKTFKFIPDKVSKYVQQLFEKKNKFTSAWLINWDEDIVHGIYPKEKTNAGLEIADKGCQRVIDNNGLPYYAYCTNIKWILGLAVKNIKGIARVCNINSNINKYSNKDIDKLIGNMIIAQDAIPRELMKNPVWYVSPKVYCLFQLKLMSKTNIFIDRVEKPDGKYDLYLFGVLVKRIYELKDDENRIE